MVKAVSKGANYYVQFRLIHMPCCHTLICWINPRRPVYCPECGRNIFRHFPKDRWEATYSEAWLRVKDDAKANYDVTGHAIEDDLKQIVIDYHTKDGE